MLTSESVPQGGQTYSYQLCVNKMRQAALPVAHNLRQLVLDTGAGLGLEEEGLHSTKAAVGNTCGHDLVHDE